MRLLEGIFLWMGISGYVLSFCLFLASTAFKRPRPGRAAWKFLVVGFILHTLTIVARWVESGHPPVLWSYEHALVSAWFVSIIFIVAGSRLKSIRSVGVVISPLVIMVLGIGMMVQGTELEPLPPPYQSNWLWVHVTFAWLAYSAFIVAAVLAILHLLKKRAVDKGKAFLSSLPAPERLDELTYEVILFGFVGLTVEMGAGAIWAYGLWARYWAWDPMEIWTLISWLTYGLYLHLRVGMGWRGRRMAWLAILAFAFIMIAFGGIAMMRGLHGTLV